MGCELDAEWAAKANERIRTCDPANLSATLSPRDLERFTRWTDSSKEEREASVGRKANTERVRKRLADKKRNGAPAPEAKVMTDVWAEAYQRCLVECAPKPKTSAAERTVPLPFDDEYIAKKWRDAYERCLAEVCAPLPASPEISAERMEQWQAASKVPPHVLTELGMHPALVDEPVRNRAVILARHKGLPDDWEQLQKVAPPGFFTQVLQEAQRVPGENLAPLVEELRTRGLKVTLIDVAGWSPIRRDVARAWLVQGSERPDFLDSYVTECLACDREDERPFTHVCAQGESTAIEPAPAPEADKKRGKGRPPGSKNKMPKPWKDAMARVSLELS